MRYEETVFRIKIECQSCGVQGWLTKIIPDIKEWDKCPQCGREGWLREID